MALGYRGIGASRGLRRCTMMGQGATATPSPAARDCAFPSHYPRINTATLGQTRLFAAMTARVEAATNRPPLFRSNDRKGILRENREDDGSVMAY